MGIALTYGKVLGQEAYFFRLGDLIVAIDPLVLSEEMKLSRSVHFPLEAVAEKVNNILAKVMWIIPRPESVPGSWLFLVEAGVNQDKLFTLGEALVFRLYGYITYQNGGPYNCWFVGVSEGCIERFKVEVKAFGLTLL